MMKLVQMAHTKKFTQKILLFDNLFLIPMRLERPDIHIRADAGPAEDHAECRNGFYKTEQLAYGLSAVLWLKADGGEMGAAAFLNSM